MFMILFRFMYLPQITTLRDLSRPSNSVVKLTNRRPNVATSVYCERKAITQPANAAMHGPHGLVRMLCGLCIAAIAGD